MENLPVTENTVSARSREIFAFPITWRLIEYRAIIVRIPERIAGIFNFVYKTPVITPAAAPQIIALRIPQPGFTFEEISEAATAPPRGKLPSQVMSGTSRTRKDKKTPIASIDHISPWATVDINRSNINFTPQNRLRSCRLPVIQI